METLGNSYTSFLKLKEKKSPKDQPFLYLYQASDLIDKIILNEKKILQTSNNEKEQECIVALLEYQKALVLVAVDEQSSAQSILLNCLKVLTNFSMDPRFAVPFIDINNQLAILWFDWGDHLKAKKFLLKAEESFEEFRKLDEVPYPDFLSKNVETNWNCLDETYTLTCYYLAQIFGALNLKDKSAEYCRKTLERQLDSRNLDKLTWALDSMTLSQYYTDKNAFYLAHHCLSCSEYIINKLKEDFKLCGEISETERLERTYADLNFIWAKFYLIGLKASAERYNLKPKDELDIELNKVNGDEEEVREENNPLGENLFEKLLNAPDFKKNQLKPRLPANFNDVTKNEAQKIFLQGLTCLESAKKFFVIDGFVTDHVLLCQDQSQFYQLLTTFESDPEKKIKLQKKRIDILSLILGSKLSPIHFQAQIRELQYELATCFEIICDLIVEHKLNFENFNEKHNLNSNKVSLFNDYILKAILHYSDFTNSFNLTGVVDSDDLIVIMTAKWRAARLYTRLIPIATLEGELGIIETQQKKLDWLKTSCKMFLEIKEYIKIKGTIEGFENEEILVENMIEIISSTIKEMESST
ncbi:hypothetical protein HDU92_001963 [Lobulomyces angularis]|nr:hypothetical protein HDU92_001963 [Lobulomyces angularis]